MLEQLIHLRNLTLYLPIQSPDWALDLRTLESSLPAAPGTICYFTSLRHLSLLEELTLRLLETDDSPTKKIKDLSRFINMIILRLFATGRRMSIFR